MKGIMHENWVSLQVQILIMKTKYHCLSQEMDFSRMVERLLKLAVSMMYCSYTGHIDVLS